jgi:hypothetical protein
VTVPRAFLWFIPLLLVTPLFTGVSQTSRPDTLRHAVVAADSGALAVQGDTMASPVRRTKSPSTAMLLSGILPGAGQVYNESYWKAPLVLGLGLYFVSEWLDNNRRAQDYREKYALSLQIAPGVGNPVMLKLRDFYKDQRDSFTWYFFILYVLNIVDAYVDASLYGFDVSPTLTMRGIPAAGLSIRFNW